MLLETNGYDFKDMVVYLCGPMDFAKDSGIKWRDDITPKLIEIGFEPRNILNPCKKPKTNSGQGLSEEQRLVAELREKGDWEGVCRIVKKIMALDLRMVDKSDVVIVNLSDCERATGTIHEIVIARMQHKPVYVIDNKGKKNVSGWLMALVGHQRVYQSVEDVIEQIRRVKERGPLSHKDMKDYLIFNFDERDTDE